MFDVFTRVGDTCEVFDSAVARVCVCYSDVSHVCVDTMLDSTTLPKICSLYWILTKANIHWVFFLSTKCLRMGLASFFSYCEVLKMFGKMV